MAEHDGVEGLRLTEPDLAEFPSTLRGRRILLCTESFGPVNGVSRTTLMLVNHLRANGVQVAVVAPHNHTKHNTFTPPASPALSPTDRQPEVRVTGYPLPFNPELSIVYPVRNSTLYARTFGLDAAPDLIYLASPASLGFQVMLQLRQQPRENQVPIICNFQTDLAGYCKILFPAPFSHIADYAFSVVQSFLFRHASVKTIFYPSRFVQRYLSRQGVQQDKMELLQRGVKTEVFDPSKRSDALRKQIAPDGEVIFVTVSRIAGEKGFDFLAKAAKELQRRRLNFKLYIVGGNRNPDVENQIHDLFEPLVGHGTVQFAGFKTGDDLATAYASGDVFLHPSITETFGLVVLESMASGVPVIARDEGGPSDIVREGKTGYLTEKDDLRSFCDRAVQLAEDARLRAEMGRAARLQAEGCTWERIGNKVAWKMSETILAREDELAKMPPSPWLSPALSAAGMSSSSRLSPPSSPQLTPLTPPAMSASSALAGSSTSKGSIADHLVPLGSWMLLGEAVRFTLMKRYVDARLMGGLGIILSCWALTGWYVFISECLVWSQGRMRRGSGSGAALRSSSSSSS